MSIKDWKKGLGVLAVVAGIVSLGACTGSSSPSSPTAPNPAPSGGGSGTADVMITNNGMMGAQSFSPSPATVKVGQTVSWHNADVITHTATGTGWDTGQIPAGQTSAPIKFSTAGTQNYHCAIHPSMTGVLNVQ